MKSVLRHYLSGPQLRRPIFGAVDARDRDQPLHRHRGELYRRGAVHRYLAAEPSEGHLDVFARQLLLTPAGARPGEAAMRRPRFVQRGPVALRQAA